MRTLLIAGACIVLASTSALACRGTAEFPQASERLGQSTISPERMQKLMSELARGQAIHEEGHRSGDGNKMREALRILDGVREKIEK